MSDYFKIGKIAGTHGISGQLVLVHSLGHQTSLKGLETIFIEKTKGSFLPYFLTETKIKNHTEVFLSIEGITTREAARIFLKREIWLTQADFKTFASPSAPISLLGYMIIDDKEEIGEIIEVIEQPHQILCKIMLDEKEALIPLHEESLLKTDIKNRRVYVDIPEGLLDIYREA
ncbi:MAG: ribosome maturation factor RimM [Ginsengibacter sp.]